MVRAVRFYLLLTAALSVACGVSDAIDGEADDPGDCCWLLSEDEVAQCMRDSIDDWSLYKRDANGCIDAVCFPSLWADHVLVCPAE